MGHGSIVKNTSLRKPSDVRSYIVREVAGGFRRDERIREVGRSCIESGCKQCGKVSKIGDILNQN